MNIDNTRETRHHIRIYDDDLDNPATKALWESPTGLLLRLVRDACRSERHFSVKCKEYLHEGRVCAEHSYKSLSDAMGVSRSTIQRYLKTLADQGFIVVLEQGDGTERSIYQVGYVTNLPLPGGGVDRVFRYYMHDPLTEGVVKSEHPGVVNSEHPGVVNSDHQAHRESNTVGRETTPVSDGPAAPSQGRKNPQAEAKPSPGSIRIKGSLVQKGDQAFSDHGGKRGRDREKPQRVSVPEAWDNLNATDGAKEGKAYFKERFIAVMGRAPSNVKGKTFDAVRDRLADGVDLEDFKKVVDLYLKDYKLLGHDEPKLIRMAHPHWFEKLYKTIKEGTPLVEKRDLSGGVQTEDDIREALRLREEEKW